ncbi:MAG TPA: proton-conducting transporter membrane subunit [Bryobacteraceae bacterium]|jgi:hydrogenase-4 component F|nr:proton-conducting transporter membrane subunit [Bryobacteraceae bacterium]
MPQIFLPVMFLAPAVAGVVCLTTRKPRVSEYTTLLASLLVLAASVPVLLGALHQPTTFWASYVIVDDLGAWVMLCVAIVYALSTLYAIGYMRLLKEDDRLPRFYALFSGFAITMLGACVMNNIGVYWIAIELTTLISTFLVGFEEEAESTEAAWKYIVVVSAGITLALLGTVLFYWGGSFVLGPTYSMTWAVLRAAAPRIYPPLLTVSFLLVLVGYGTKAGLVPMHTWLPDAHSESPAPVSAMLSGALLNSAMLGIARFLSILNLTSVSRFAHTAVVSFGILSFVVAALFITRQTGIKRLMAYSSVEHLGIQALGLGFGGPLGIAGALYHMLNHSLNKSLMFFGAGNAMRGYETKEIAGIRNILSVFPVTGCLWLAGAVAIAGAPPFALFLSEFTILRAGLAGDYHWAVFLFLVFLIVVFIAFLAHFRRMYFARASGISVRTLTGVFWRGLPMWLAFLPLLVLGLWWPRTLWAAFIKIAAELGGGLH